MTTRPVVVGVDGSEESLRAVEWAALEAERRRSPLRIVSAPAVPPRMRLPQSPPETVTAALRGISARALAAAITRCEEIAPGLLIDTDLLSGAPALAVTDSGAGASMLVVGARGLGGFAAMLLGSVSRYTATHASCPVVVVREDSMAVHREIAVGIRDPHDTTEAVAFAFEEAALRGAELVVVHSWYAFPAGLLATGATDAGRRANVDARQVAEHAAGSLAEAVSGWREKFPAVRVRQDVVQGHPARVLASYAARADLVVLGRHGGGNASGPGIGSIQHAVLNHAGGPVAIVPSCA